MSKLRPNKAWLVFLAGRLCKQVEKNNNQSLVVCGALRCHLRHSTILPAGQRCLVVGEQQTASAGAATCASIDG